MMFWSMVGQASFQTAPRMGPSTIERSKPLELLSARLPDEVEAALTTIDPVPVSILVEVRFFFLSA